MESLLQGHQRGIDEDSHVGIRDEPFQAVPAAADSEPQPLPDSLLHRRDELGGGGDETHVVGLAGESLVESAADQNGVARIVGSDPAGRGLAGGCLGRQRGESRRAERSRSSSFSARAGRSTTIVSHKILGLTPKYS